MADPAETRRHLARVRRAAAAREKSEAAWHAAIRTAVADGATLRAVAEAAGISHSRVLQITRNA